MKPDQINYIIITAGFVLSVIVGLIGRKRNMSFLHAFVMAVILSPVLGIIIVLLHKKEANGSNP